MAKEAGMKGIIITAKHHDGFCLWPSEYSTHTVRESPWRDGKGDLLQELSQSCKKYDLQMGVYLSPWDQNHPTYNTAEYNQTFANTLTEVLTNYGPIFEQWFDGATDGSSNQVYDWDLFHQTVYKHQPQAIIFSDVGPGARWIGNER
ncbi:MAG: alpha-L-fucosidase, partial [Bacteroides sp.]|nr:alpha-L-fucosidase [Bacteroides sp.]